MSDWIIEAVVEDPAVKRDLFGRILGDRPFERPWMVSHIDKDLLPDPHLTWQRLQWRPRGRLLLCRQHAVR